MFGGFYSHVNRKYAQRLPTPGYDAIGDLFLQELCLDVIAQSGATCRVNAPLPANRIPFVSTDAAIANGFPTNSPYNADLPYVIKQAAAFGEASYKIGQFKLTAGGRWYDFKEKRDFISGGIFSNGDTRIGDKTKSNGFSPRGIVSWEPNRSLSVNVQVAKGFRLGGINDPLNLPICTAADRAIYGPFASATYNDETLWNYEAGVKYSKRGLTFNAAAFHNQIKNLQVTVDAGSCSSRLVFNVPKAHTTGVEAEFSVHPLAGLDLSLAGSIISSKFDSTIADPVLRDPDRHPRWQPSSDRSEIPVRGNGELRPAVGSNADWNINASVQRVGNRFTQPGDQEPGAGIFDLTLLRPCDPRLRRRAEHELRLAQASGLHAGQCFGRCEVGQRSRGSGLRQEHLRHEREAVA